MTLCKQDNGPYVWWQRWECANDGHIILSAGTREQEPSTTHTCSCGSAMTLTWSK